MNVAYRNEGDVQPADSDRGQVDVVDVTDTRGASSKTTTAVVQAMRFVLFIDRDNWLFPVVPLPPTAWRACLDYMAPRAATAGRGDTLPGQYRRLVATHSPDGRYLYPRGPRTRDFIERTAGVMVLQQSPLCDVESGSKDSVLNSSLVQYTYPAGPGGQTSVEFAINPALIAEAFAADLPAETTALMAATQRPIAAAGFSDASGPPAWKKLRSWAVVAAGDKAAGADVVRSMAQRAGADIVEVEGSHVIMISQPQTVSDHILKAARAVADSHR